MGRRCAWVSISFLKSFAGAFVKYCPKANPFIWDGSNETGYIPRSWNDCSIYFGKVLMEYGAAMLVPLITGFCYAPSTECRESEA